MRNAAAWNWARLVIGGVGKAHSLSTSVVRHRSVGGGLAVGSRTLTSGVGTHQDTIAKPNILYKADVRRTTQSPNRLDKAPTDYTKPNNIRQNLKL